MTSLLDNSLLVREHIPLEQGLRPIQIPRPLLAFPPVREHIPLEQGLRQHSALYYIEFSQLSESIFH